MLNVIYLLLLSFVTTEWSSEEMEVGYLCVERQNLCLQQISEIKMAAGLNVNFLH